MSHCYLHTASRQYIDDILLISCFHACDMSCALFMTTICTHDMLAMIPSSTLHLRTTSLLHLITMLASMPLPCNCDPCLHLPMIHHYATSMCICMIGGDPCCYCHVYHVPHAIDAIFLISSFHGCAMPCELFMHNICTHDMLAMISTSTLHLRTTS